MTMLILLLPLFAVLGWGLHMLLAARADQIERCPSGDRPPGREGGLPIVVTHSARFDSNDDPSGHFDDRDRRHDNGHLLPLLGPLTLSHCVGGVQTTQRALERLGRPGQPVDVLPLETITRMAEVSCRPGQLAIRGTAAASAGNGAKIPVAAAAALATAIITTLGSTTGIQTFTGAGLTGAVGAARMLPARNIVIVLSSSADWDATTAVITGEDEYGRVITENLAIPNNGNATVTGLKAFSKVTSVVIPAQSDTGGTATVGTGTLLGVVTSRDVLGLIRYLAARAVTAPSTDTTEYHQYDTLAVVTKGAVWVSPEVAVSDGQQVYVRFVVNGGLAVGNFTNADDGTLTAPNCVPVIGMRFRGDSETRDAVIMARADCDFIA